MEEAGFKDEEGVIVFETSSTSGVQNYMNKSCLLYEKIPCFPLKLIDLGIFHLKSK